MSKNLIHNGREMTVSSPAKVKVAVDDREYNITNVVHNRNEISFILNGEKQRCYIAEYGDDVFVFLKGKQYKFTKPSSFKRKSSSTTDGSVASPMPGNLIALNCVVGCEVKEGDVLAVVEAMKMENPLRAPFEGKVASINYDVGDLVDSGKTIIQIEKLG